MNQSTRNRSSKAVFVACVRSTRTRDLGSDFRAEQSGRRLVSKLGEFHSSSRAYSSRNGPWTSFGNPIENAQDKRARASLESCPWFRAPAHPIRRGSGTARWCLDGSSLAGSGIVGPIRGHSAQRGFLAAIVPRARYQPRVRAISTASLDLWERQACST